MKTFEDIKPLIQRKVQEHGSKVAFAEHVGMSRQYLEAVLKKKKPVPIAILREIGHGRDMGYYEL